MSDCHIVFMSAYITNVSVCPKLVQMNNSRIRSKFKGSCLKQKNKNSFYSKECGKFIYCL